MLCVVARPSAAQPAASADHRHRRSFCSVATFLEMTLSSSRNGSLHVAPLQPYAGTSFKLAACDLGEQDCSTQFSFGRSSRLKLFRGPPVVVPDVAAALDRL